MMRRAATVLTASVATVGMTLTGCSSSGGADHSTSTPSRSSSAAASATSGTDTQLAKFYAQKLQWKDCGNVQCTTLEVPVDYAKPAGATVKLSVDKVPASGDRKGSLVVNPGGPGGSGYDYAAAAADGYVVSSQVHAAYDVVGFDPRGVQRSAPITCVDDAALDRYLGADPTPDDAAEEKSAVAQTKAFGQACKSKGGVVVGHVSTVEVAKDMDVLRAALGEEKLDYLGKSYGTFLGSTYAGLFPQRVGRFVLDGVVPPDLSTEQVNLGQAKGFEQATRAYVRDCVADGDCPLGNTLDAGMQRIRDFLKSVDAKPLPVTGEGDVRQLTEGWASNGIAQAMYTKSYWPTLTSAFRQAFKGDGNGLMALADAYADRSSDGTYDGNIMQVINAVNCLDRPASSDVSTYAAQATAFAKQAPTWGPLLAWGSLTCGEWPIKATGKAQRITAAGSGPILVVGTTRDPATPYEWSKRLADQLANGHLLTYDGDGHTAYKLGSSCVDGVVDAYLLKGTVPADGKAC